MLLMLDNDGLRDCFDDLRHKYADLSCKYVALDERLEQRYYERMAVYCLGYLGLRVVVNALALVRLGKMMVRAGAWDAMVRFVAAAKRWTTLDAEPRRSHDDLWFLVIDKTEHFKNND